MAIAVAVSLHSAILLLLLGPRHSAAVAAPPAGVDVTLVTAFARAAPPAAPPSSTSPTPPSDPAPAPTTAAPDAVSPPPDVATAPAKAATQSVATEAIQSDAVATPQSETPGKSCDVVGALQTALRDDPGVREAIARIPRQKRSVAGAVMLWNQTWVDPQALGGSAALTPIQAAVRRTVLAASPACRDQTVQGPRMFMVADQSGTIILTLGSGQWQWTQLLDPIALPSTHLEALLRWAAK